MKTTNNLSKNQRNIIFSSFAAENKMPYNISIYLELRYYVEYGLSLLRAKFEKNSSSGF